MRFVRGHALVYLLPPVDTSSYSLHICLALVSAALPGFGWQGGLYSHKFYTRLLALLESSHFFFKRWIPTPWIFYYNGFSAVYNSDSLLRALLSSWGSFDCSMSLTFLEGVTQFSAIFSNSSSARWTPPPFNLLGAIWSGLCVVDRLDTHPVALPWDLDCRWFPCDELESKVLS